MEDLTRLLKAHPFLEGLDADQVKVLVGCAKNLRFDAGQYLFHEGDEARTFYLIREGRVSLDVHIPGKGALRVETVEPGDVLGLSWMFPPSRIHLDARAVDAVVALMLDGTCLRGKMEADPVLGFALTKRLLDLTHQRLERVRLQRLDVYKAS
ncbi:MAG: cyclic nucleotide-binding domain-containing protein [Byssovorax sp.]